MSHRHVVVCDGCNAESQFDRFGMWGRFSMGGDMVALPENSWDFCSEDCFLTWLKAEVARREGVK